MHQNQNNPGLWFPTTATWHTLTHQNGWVLPLMQLLHLHNHVFALMQNAAPIIRRLPTNVDEIFLISSWRYQNQQIQSFELHDWRYTRFNAQLHPEVTIKMFESASHPGQVHGIIYINFKYGNKGRLQMRHPTYGWNSYMQNDCEKHYHRFQHTFRNKAKRCEIYPKFWKTSPSVNNLIVIGLIWISIVRWWTSSGQTNFMIVYNFTRVLSCWVM
jgi:hypothetical protein